MTTLTKFEVTLNAKDGIQLVVELLSSQGPEAAGRRALWAAIAQREYGDVDEITIASVTEVPEGAIEIDPGDSMCEWFAGCTRPATHFEAHPALGEVPACNRCPAIGR